MILPELSDQGSWRIAEDQRSILPAFHWNSADLSITTRGHGDARVSRQPRAQLPALRSVLTVLASLAHR